MIINHSKYSVLLKALLEDEATKNKIEKALSSYPLYKNDKNYDLIPTRDEINKRLLNHYKYREIGVETVGRFVDELEIVMCEIMPYYNELFKTIVTMYEIPNPFDNVDVVETYEEERKDTSKSKGNSTASQNSKNTHSTNQSQTGTNKSENSNSVEAMKKFSDTPQNSVTNIDNYLTEHTVDNSIGTNKTNESSTTAGQTNGSSTNNVSENSSSAGESETTGYVKHKYTKVGNQGVNTYAHDMNEFRTSIIDVVDQIINDKRVNELFMLIY